MLPAPFRVVLDACVLLPMTLCDTLLRSAERDLLDLKPELMIELLQQQADDHENPPTSLDELLDALAKSVPDFVTAVRAHIGR